MRFLLDHDSFPRFTMCGVSAAVLLGSLITLGCIDEDDERHNFGHQGGNVLSLKPFVSYSYRTKNEKSS